MADSSRVKDENQRKSAENPGTRAIAPILPGIESDTPNGDSRDYSEEEDLKCRIIAGTGAIPPISNGYYQTTLTNFERVAFRGSDRRFLYEESAFRPEEHDMVGFGPGAYSLIADGPFQQTRRSLPRPVSVRRSP